KGNSDQFQNLQSKLSALA
ncbi:unnamed protein product, partial [Allacma fusca]